VSELRNVTFDHLFVPQAEIKAHKDSGTGLYTRLEGIASVFGVVDEQGDIVEKGAFTKTIEERVPRGLVRLMDSHRYDISHTLGTVREAKETDLGLWFSADLASTPDAQVAAQKAAEGHLKLSIGYQTVNDAWEKQNGRMVRKLKEVKLLEISLVPLAANESTAVTLVKAVVPFQDLPLASEDRPWDAAAAELRVRRWAGGPDKEGIDWAKYRKAFVLWNPKEPENFGSYKLPIADIIDGKLMAVPRGIFAAAAALMGARGGVLPFDEGDIEGAKRHISRYYKKMGRVAPWDRDEKYNPWEIAISMEEALSRKEGRVLSQANLDRLKEVLRLIQEILKAAEPESEEVSTPSSAELERRARMLQLEIELAS